MKLLECVFRDNRIIFFRISSYFFTFEGRWSRLPKILAGSCQRSSVSVLHSTGNFFTIEIKLKTLDTFWFLLSTGFTILVFYAVWSSKLFFFLFNPRNIKSLFSCVKWLENANSGRQQRGQTPPHNWRCFQFKLKFQS